MKDRMGMTVNGTSEMAVAWPVLRYNQTAIFYCILMLVKGLSELMSVCVPAGRGGGDF